MFPFQKTQLNSLEEDFKALGMDPRALDTIDRQTRLVEQRVGVPGDEAPSGGAPPVSVPASLHEDVDLGGDDDVDDDTPPAGGFTEDDIDYEPMVDLSDIDAANQTEAMRVVRKKIKTAGEKLKSRRKYRKRRAASRKAARQYRKRNKRKIARRQRMKMKKFGGAKGLAKARRGGKRRIVMAGTEMGDELAQLREDVNSIGSGVSSGDYLGPYEEAAFNAGWLSMLIGESAEALGDHQTAETLFTLSDNASDLSEELEGVMDEEDLSESQEADLRGLIDSTIKAMRFYEGLGWPTLAEAHEFAEAQLTE